MTNEAVARVKVWLELDGDYIFGRGICDILQAVQASGSMKEAAEIVGKSYRHVWARIKDAEQSLGQPLVTTTVGGASQRRSELTPLAKELVADFTALRQSVRDFTARQYARKFSSLH